MNSHPAGPSGVAGASEDPVPDSFSAGADITTYIDLNMLEQLSMKKKGTNVELWNSTKIGILRPNIRDSPTVIISMQNLDSAVRRRRHDKQNCYFLGNRRMHDRSELRNVEAFVPQRIYSSTSGSSPRYECLRFVPE